MSLYSLLREPVSQPMVRFLADATRSVVHTPARHADPKLPSLEQFINALVEQTHVYTPTLLTAAVYLARLRKVLPGDAQGVGSTAHRIFLACLILSAKNHNDSSPLNRHWTKYTDGLFTLEDVNLMERQLLQLLQWNVRVSDDDLARTLAPLYAVPTPTASPLHTVTSKLPSKLRNASASSVASSTHTLVESQPALSVQPTKASPPSRLDALMARYGF